MTSDIGDQYTPAVRSFIPLLYLAWADGLLSPSEVEIIHNQVDALPHLTRSEKEVLRKWSDPRVWPDDQVFKTWMQLLKEAGKELDYHSVNSIVSLGIEMSERAQVGMTPETTEA
ncbi:MAG: TerB family tellurite resistance protein, partial [Saprospiraceae bacterium]|nr:TerB family tellurite resistance protein [Saprospiraceae bacterium]